MNAFAKVISNILTLGLEYYGRYYSRYRGFVMSNEDPEGLGRLQLKVPEVYGKDTLNYWAYPAHTYSGKGYGAQVIPEKGDLVWVEFEQGSPRRPVWSHGHYGNNDISTELVGPGKFWFKTPGGHILLIDEKVDPPIIKMVHASGLGIQADDELLHLGTFSADEQFTVLGETLKARLETLNQRVDAIYDALSQSSTGSQDGGALYKSQINIKLNIAPPTPDLSNILSTKVKND